MKKIITLVSLCLSACTISDVYWKPDVGQNNVATFDSVEHLLKNDDSLVGYYEYEKYSDFCLYFFGIKGSSDCSPDKIAKDYGLKTITEVNTQLQYVPPLIFIQRTTIKGIPQVKQ